MFTRTVENTSPTRQRVNESQSVHSLALRACNGAKHGAVQLGVPETEHQDVLYASCWRIDLCETDWAIDLRKESE
jgi:hypothetical protein